ncbi:hypothetical protein Cantr_07825 [Candida viswanathii]|uniref:Enoyl reductase (ER) domain-containing protein n=1 Tax=Candida viswanathii TaxID=5486 RepID=A0A367XZ65_9ASCO|nr:hypothetical protein Cantr_07825 [Candida viswanathii]
MVKAAVISGSFEPNQLVVVKDIPKPPIKDDEILIKSVAFAVNPTDWKHIVYELGKPDDVVGCDISGVIEDVGSKVQGFAKGDTVSTFITGSRSPITGAFSEYVAVNPATAIRYTKDLNNPPTLESTTIQSFEGAASVNLGLVTVGLSFSHYLQLGQQKKDRDVILIWGGATATGILAIQIAKQYYGLTVVTTASPKNHEYLKELGADYVFDYNDPEVVSKIQKVGKIKFALDIISTPETFQKTYEATENSPEVYLDSLSGLDFRSITVDPNRKDDVHWGNTIACLALVKEKDVFNQHYVQTPELIKDFEKWWQEVVPKVIDTIRHTKLRVLDNGLDSVNEALELSRNHELSAEKVIFRV